MLELTEVSKVYRNGAEVYPVLDGVSLTLDAGELLVLSGASGSGKTTLLNIAGCLTRPTRGRVLLNGEDVSQLPDHLLSEVRRHAIGIVFQQYNLLPGFTAMENVEIPLLPRGIAERQRQQQAAVVLERVGLAAKMHSRIHRLSGGEQQRVALARALINDPGVILADEPTSNIDEETARLIVELFAELRRQGRAILVASHDIVWREEADGLYELREGRLLEREYV